MAQSQKTLDELLSTLGEEINQVKVNPFSITIASTANTSSIQTYLSNINTQTEYEKARVKLFGKNGVIPVGFADLRNAAPDIRPRIGEQRKALVAAIETLIVEIQ